MLPNCKSRRGMTLAEIMVALGLVAIMIVMVVSFALLISERTRANAENLGVQQERSMIKSGVEVWLNAVTAENAALSLKTANPETLITESTADLEITRSGTTVQAAITGEAFTLSFANGVLKGQLPDGKAITVHAESVESMEFHLAKKTADEEPEYLLYCVVTGEQGTYTFCVNPHVGEGGAF